MLPAVKSHVLALKAADQRQDILKKNKEINKEKLWEVSAAHLIWFVSFCLRNRLHMDWAFTVWYK